MAWTFDPAIPTRKDEVRLMVGDTDTTDQMIQNESIENALTQFVPVDGKPPWLAAAVTCDAIAGRFGRQAQHATNGLGIISGSMAGVVAAAPVLGGGGRTYLGGNLYSNPEGS
jgi:hypothetical protein